MGRVDGEVLQYSLAIEFYKREITECCWWEVDWARLNHASDCMVSSRKARGVHAISAMSTCRQRHARCLFYDDTGLWPGVHACETCNCDI